jgi:hypothetical protein
MKIQFDKFVWQRPATGDGFRWAGESLERVKGAKFEDYQPKEGLFRDFADVETADDVLNFVNRHGQTRERPEWEPPLPLWLKLASEMRRLVSLQDSLRHPVNVDKLRANLPRGTSIDQIVNAAVMDLARDVPRFQPLGRWDAKGKEACLLLKHENLYTYLHFQRLRALLESHKFDRCDWCKRWFRLDTRGKRKGRSDRETCSDKCRNQRHRARRAKKKRKPK